MIKKLPIFGLITVVCQAACAFGTKPDLSADDASFTIFVDAGKEIERLISLVKVTESKQIAIEDMLKKTAAQNKRLNEEVLQLNSKISQLSEKLDTQEEICDEAQRTSEENKRLDGKVSDLSKKISKLSKKFDTQENLCNQRTQRYHIQQQPYGYQIQQVPYGYTQWG